MSLRILVVPKLIRAIKARDAMRVRAGVSKRSRLRTIGACPPMPRNVPRTDTMGTARMRAWDPAGRRWAGLVSCAKMVSGEVSPEKMMDYEIEEKQRDGIGRPMLLLPLMRASHGVEAAFDGRKKGRKQRALAGEDPRHIGAERFDEQQQQPAEQKDLKPSKDGHGTWTFKQPDAARQKRSGRRRA